MKNLPLLFLLGCGCVTSGVAAEGGWTETSRAALGGAARVFEIERGAAVVNGSIVQRIDVSEDKNSVIFTVRNGTGMPAGVATRVLAEFFNRYGMPLCTVDGLLDDDTGQPGKMETKRFDLTYPELERVFKDATPRLPADWRELRFVRLVTGGQARATWGKSAIDPLRPRPRPPAKGQPVRPRILAEGPTDSTSLGLMAVDMRWKNYGSYLQRVMESVQIQWERLLTEAKIFPPPGTTVTVKFVLDSAGKIARVVKVDSTANEAAARACVSAITDRAPYGAWTDDMKAVLGEQQEITFTFYYQ